MTELFDRETARFAHVDHAAGTVQIIVPSESTHLICSALRLSAAALLEVPVSDLVGINALRRDSGLLDDLARRVLDAATAARALREDEYRTATRAQAVTARRAERARETGQTTIEGTGS